MGQGQCCVSPAGLGDVEHVCVASVSEDCSEHIKCPDSRDSDVTTTCGSLIHYDSDFEESRVTETHPLVEFAAGDDSGDEVEAIWACTLESDTVLLAGMLLQEGNVLKAELVLARAMDLLQRRTSGPARQATERLASTAVYTDVRRRTRLYDSIGKCLQPADFHQIWNQDWGHLTWRRKGPKEFEFRSAIFLDVSLAQILASEHELDLVPRLQPDLVEAPLQLVQGDRAREVTQTLAQVLMFKIEVVSERLRFFNHDFGCVAEFLSSDFPADGVPVPPRRRVPRVSAEMSTLMIPVGGGRGGTIIVQQTRVEPGFWVPDRVMAAILKTFVPGLLANTRKGVERVSDPQEPWRARITEDADGLYKESLEVEAVAQGRSAVSLSDLPGVELFERRWRLIDEDKE